MPPLLILLSSVSQLTGVNINILCITRGHCGISKLRSPANGPRISDVSHRSELRRISGRMLLLVVNVAAVLML